MKSTYRRGHLTVDILVMSAATIVLHVVLAQQNGMIADGTLRDTDAFMRLIRIEELWQTGNWYQNVTSSLGAPQGLSLHWTRPLDILILLPALLLHIGGFAMERAIFWSGTAISPILQLLAGLAAARAARPIWEQHGAWRTAALMVLFNGAAVTYCLAGRPDHHSLGLLLTVLAAGQTIRAVMNPDNAKSAYYAGGWAAAGIWVSPEALLTVGPTLVTFGLLWLARVPSNGRNDAVAGQQWLRLGRRFSFGMAAVITVAIGVEQAPSNWLTAEYDKISILHLAIALAVAADFWLAEMLPWADWRRVFGAGAIAALSAYLLSLMFPHFYLGPLGDISNQGVKILLDDVIEMRPVMPVDADTTKQFFGMVGNSLAGLVVIPYCLWQWRRQPTFAVAILLSLSYLTAFAGALLHQRLTVPLSAYGAILGCGLFAMLCDLAAKRPPISRLAMRLAAAMIVVFGGQLWLLMPGSANGKATQATPKIAACQPKPVADWLNATHPGIVTAEPIGADRHTPIILTESVNYPPELAYRTPYRFVGGPYHRGIDDIADMTNAAMGTDDATVHAIVTRRQADFVLICVVEAPKVIGESDPNSLYHRLSRNELPAWLQPVQMSLDASREFRLFAVRR